MVADHFLQLRADLETALVELLRLVAVAKKDDPTLAETLHGLLGNIRAPLLFVVVGEVKAGKSSLLNALFGHEFAKVDVLPATDRVCIFRYGRDETIEVSPELIERHLPIDFLRDFNVVDTPGTNTMVETHQKITENFVPRADLVLFVFSVVNPWTQSAWEFLSFVQKQWLKNVVFVLQQADLREPAEITVIQRHLEDTAMQRLGFAPPIFAVSAKQALLARSGAADSERLWQKSQFAALEAQINLIVSDESASKRKLESAWQTGQLILNQIASELQAAFATIVRDEERLDRIRLFLQSRKEQTLRQVHGFVRGVEQACREAAAQGTQLLERRLTFWTTLKMVWRRADWQRDFQVEMDEKLRQIVQPQIENAVQLLETDLRGIWPQLQDTIEAQFGQEMKSQAPRTPPDFARQRRELLQSIQLTLAERVSGRAIEEQLGNVFRETSERLRIPVGVVAAGGIVAIIGAMSSAAVADVTGILAISAAVLGTIVAQRQRKKILQTYAQQMESKRADLVSAIENQITHAIDLFYSEIGAAFQPLAAFCAAQRSQQQPMTERIQKLEESFEQLRGRLAVKRLS